MTKLRSYAESGGQSADTGEISTEDAVFAVYNVTKTENGHFLHFGAIEKGSINKNDTVFAEIGVEKRMSAMRNHTAHIFFKRVKGSTGRACTSGRSACKC